MKFSGWSEFPAHEGMLDAGLAPMGEGRPEGIHQSEIIHEWKLGLGKRVGAVEGAQEGVHLIEGFLWEIVIEYMCAGMGVDQAMDLAFKRYMTALRKGIVTQVKLCKDRIHMTPDGVLYKEGETESYKATRRSFKNAKTAELFHENFWEWEVQEMGYNWALGFDTATWIVLWNAGDYSQGPGAPPKILQATATWTPEELAENWERELRTRDRIEKRRADEKRDAR